MLPEDMYIFVTGMDDVAVMMMGLMSDSIIFRVAKSANNNNNNPARRVRS
jgi:hypothetical protein